MDTPGVPLAWAFIPYARSARLVVRWISEAPVFEPRIQALLRQRDEVARMRVLASEGHRILSWSSSRRRAVYTHNGHVSFTNDMVLPRVLAGRRGVVGDDPVREYLRLSRLSAVHPEERLRVRVPYRVVSEPVLQRVKPRVVRNKSVDNIDEL